MAKRVVHGGGDRNEILFRLDAQTYVSTVYTVTVVTAKVFTSGHSQAVRIPKAFRLASDTVKLIKTPDGFFVRDEKAHTHRLKAFAALAGSCPDFPNIAANTAPNFKRDWE
jgi:virulence-associated protein VagC